MKVNGAICTADPDEALVIRGARLEIASSERTLGDLRIRRGRIEAIRPTSRSLLTTLRSIEIDLDGYLLLPGFINAHDHLEFALYPRLGNPPYRNYIEWGEDIHAKFAPLISKHHAVPKEVRVWWGAIRNLLSGVTTACHHNPLYPELTRADFPVRVVQQYGWAHSPALGGDLRAARAATPKGRPFIVHACEGVDARAREEILLLEELGILDEFSVFVHGLALTAAGVALMRRRGVSLILCPSSNYFLFGKLPDVSLLSETGRVALGSDSPLTAAGDLLDEIRFALYNCEIDPRQAFQSITSNAAEILRLNQSEGFIRRGGVADLIAVRDSGSSAEERLWAISTNEIELVIIGGVVQLASEAMRERLPFSTTQGLEPLVVGQVTRWVRAPIGELLQKAEEVLGEGKVRLGGRSVRSTITSLGAVHAC